jgi:hypothetical protein
MKRKKIDLNEIEQEKSYGPYSIPTGTGFICFFVKGVNVKKADELAFKRAEEIEKELSLRSICPN